MRCQMARPRPPDDPHGAPFWRDNPGATPGLSLRCWTLPLSALRADDQASLALTAMHKICF